MHLDMKYHHLPSKVIFHKNTVFVLTKNEQSKYKRVLIVYRVSKGLNTKLFRILYLQFCKWRSIKKFVTPLHFMDGIFYNNSRRNFLIRDKNTLVTIGTDHYATWFLCQIGIFLCYMFAINQCCIITFI